ncbi:uncharacterized protein LOC144762883 isoform X2 [Lissotriton helveticus]
MSVAWNSECANSPESLQGTRFRGMLLVEPLKQEYDGQHSGRTQGPGARNPGRRRWEAGSCFQDGSTRRSGRLCQDHHEGWMPLEEKNTGSTCGCLTF